MTKEEMNYYADKAIEDFPEWYERGELPPVDTECEFLDVRKWIAGTVSFTGESKGIFKMNNGQELLFHTNLTQFFRPIQTERQRTLRKAFALFEKNMTIAEFTKALYDAGLLKGEQQ